LIVTFCSDETPPEVRRTIRRAAQQWEECLARPGMFQVVESAAPADVVVSHSRRLRFEGKDVAGLVRVRTEYVRTAAGGWAERRLARIELATHAPNGLPQREEAMLQAAMHELGHVLGLRHDEHRRGVMGALDPSRPITTPSREEVLALTGLFPPSSDASVGSRPDDPTYGAKVTADSSRLLRDRRPDHAGSRRARRQDTRALDACM